MTGICVTTGSRLHFGLLCGAADSQWHYGGIGLMLDQPAWQLEVALATSGPDIFETSAGVRERLQRILLRFRRSNPDLPAVRFATVCEVNPHAGLGSGTQLTLAAGTALLLLSGRRRPADATQLAASLGRSRRSAIGTFGFDHGGFIIDHGEQQQSPEHRLEKIRIPEEWRFLIVTPPQLTGLSGETEENFFGEQRCLAPDVLNQIDTAVQTMIVPAIRHRRFADFRDGLAVYGRLVGEFYAPAQGGVYSSPLIRSLVDQLAERGVTGAVQSSWGPSVCIPASSPEDTVRIEEILKSCGRHPDVTVTVAKGLNVGATVRSEAPENYRSFG